jgi:hypothetical protein
MSELKGDIFHPICLEDRAWMMEKLSVEEFKACEYSFASNFIWRNVYDVQVAEIAGCGVISYRGARGCQYTFPFGDGDKKEAFDQLWDYCKNKGHRLCLSPLGDEERKTLSSWYHGRFAFHSVRDSFDYIYTVERLANLRGRKLQKKRNHIARFKDGDDWSYEPLCEDNIEKCRLMAKEWSAQREDKWSKSLAEEMGVLEEAFSNFKRLGFVGGVLYKQSRVVAFTIGEKIGDEMMIVHFEKAFPDIQGAYPMINQQFVRHECEGLKLVNREDDTGDMGLRKAKLSYYPDILLKKYVALEGEVVTADEGDRDAIMSLWQTCFGDDEAYVDFYLKNRFTAENMLVIYRDGRPVSMASFLPVTLTLGEERVAAFYVYAVATLPEYRKLGLSSKIINYAKETFEAPLILQVENGSHELESFYEKLGFSSEFERIEKREIAAEKNEEDEFELKEISSVAYRKLRDLHFAGVGYVSWNEEAIAYALNENRFCGGNAYSVKGEEREDILLVRAEDENLRIIETSMDEKELKKVLSSVCEEMQTKSCFIKNYGGMLYLPEKYKAPTKKGYLNLTLG